MTASASPAAVEADPDLIDLTVVIGAHQAMYSALLAVVQSPFDDRALSRVLQVRQSLVADVARAKLRIAARA